MRQPDWQTRDGSCSLHLGECRDVLRQLPDKSVQCCVTSPPYWGLRDYGHSDQIGLEPTPDEYVAKMVEVFREVRRVLRNDGTLWLNLGDSYGRQGGKTPAVTRHWDGREDDPGGMHDIRPLASECGLKPKDLVGIPWRVAFALQADGWWLRQDIIWHKPNPMPESVTDRCTKAHEYIFLLAKSERYFYDNEAVKEDASQPYGQPSTTCQHKQITLRGECVGTLGSNYGPSTRNRRSVWTVATQPYSGAHFATYPPDLIEPCILAGCQEGGVVLDPFNGSGTTGEVCIKHGRHYVGIEVNPEYLELAKERLSKATRRHATPLFEAPPKIVQRNFLGESQ